MEILGFQDLISFLKEHHLLQKLKYVIADKDGKIAKKIRETEELKHIQILHDPGHWVKGVVHRVEEALGSGKEFLSFVTRIKRWFIYCVKEAENTVRKQLNIEEVRSLKLLEVHSIQ